MCLWRSFCWQCTQTLRIAAHSSLCYSGPLFCKGGCKPIFLNAFHPVCVHGPQWQVQFSRSVVSDSLQPPGLQHARPLCPSPTPRVYPNSYPLSQWCHPTISSCHPLLLPPSVFPSIRVFSNESALRTRWPKYWSFSFNISPSSEHSGLISFRMDWLDVNTLVRTLYKGS